jgi:hypothetical protein
MEMRVERKSWLRWRWERRRERNGGRDERVVGALGMFGVEVMVLRHGEDIQAQVI